MYVVFYATVNEGENGTEVQSPFLGGIAPSQQDSECLAYDIVNDKTIPGTVIPKILVFNKIDEFKRKYNFAVKHFDQMTIDICNYEMTQKRMRQKKCPVPD